MNTGVVIALALAIPIGVTLGALGAGGTILALPIFVYIAGIPANQAVAMSKVVVGGASLCAAILYYARGYFHVQAVALFALTGVVAAYFGSWLTDLVSHQVLMLTFAALMLAAGVAMLWRQPELKTRNRCRVLHCLGIGTVTGLLTGFLGVGGGFVIVPALIVFAGIEMKKAVGSSLAVIAVNAAAGLIGQLHRTSIDWWLSLGFLGLAVLGMFGGIAVATRVPGPQLHKTLGWLITVLAVVIAALNLLGAPMPEGQ